MRWLVLCLIPGFAHGESVVTTRNIPARTVLTTDDVTVVDAAIPGAAGDPALVIGQETRRAIHAGRPVLGRDIGPATAVERNARVLMRYQTGGLQITAEGRALEKGAVGDVVRVMAASSRSIVSARIAKDGSVIVEE